MSRVCLAVFPVGGQVCARADFNTRDGLQPADQHGAVQMPESKRPRELNEECSLAGAFAIGERL